MWKRAVLVEGKKEEGVEPDNWVVEESQTLFWPQGVNAKKALHNQQEPGPKLLRRFLLKKIKLACGRYFSYSCILSLHIIILLLLMLTLSGELKLL